MFVCFFITFFPFYAEPAILFCFQDIVHTQVHLGSQPEAKGGSVHVKMNQSVYCYVKPVISFLWLV